MGLLHLNLKLKGHQRCWGYSSLKICSMARKVRLFFVMWICPKESFSVFSFCTVCFYDIETAHTSCSLHSNGAVCTSLLKQENQMGFKLGSKQNPLFFVCFFKGPKRSSKITQLYLALVQYTFFLSQTTSKLKTRKKKNTKWLTTGRKCVYE